MKAIKLIAAVTVIVVALVIWSDMSDDAKRPHTDAEKKTVDEKNAQLNSGQFADTSVLHWSYDPVRDSYDLYFADGYNCQVVGYDKNSAQYSTLDPLDPESDKMLGKNDLHRFAKLEDARSYLWHQCLIKELARRIDRSKLAPGETPQN